MLPEKGVFGKQSIANLGKSQLLRPTRRQVAGEHIYSEDFTIVPSVSAAPENQYDAENVSIVIDAAPTSVLQAVDATLNTFIIYGVITWQVGQSLFGFIQDTNVPAGGALTTSKEVIFDIHLGVAFTLPAAAAVTLKVRVVAVSNAGFTGGAGVPVFPTLRVNGGYSYGTIDPFDFTYTQYVVTGNDITLATPFSLAPTAPGPAGTGTISKPKFASSVRIVWENYTAATPLIANFDGYIAGAGWGPITLVGNTLPPPTLPWPVDSWFLTITNGDAADTPTFVKVISNLSL